MEGWCPDSVPLEDEDGVGMGAPHTRGWRRERVQIPIPRPLMSLGAWPPPPLCHRAGKVRLGSGPVFLLVNRNPGGLRRVGLGCLSS